MFHTNSFQSLDFSNLTLGSGPKGRGFESRHFDSRKPLKPLSFKGFLLFMGQILIGDNW